MQHDLFASRDEGAALIERLTGEPSARVAELIAEFGGVAPILAAEPTRLRSAGLSAAAIDWLSTAKVAANVLLQGRIETAPVLSSWDKLLDYLTAACAWEPVEVVRVLFLNSKNMLLRSEEVSRGSIAEASVYVRDIMHRALNLGATAIIIAHNHPSGDPTPSSQDVRLTKELASAGKALGIALHDHVIVGRGGARASFRALGLI